MLFVPIATRVNFCAMKLTSLVALEQLSIPKVFGPVRVDGATEAGGGTIERLVPARRAQDAVVADQRLGQAGVLHRHVGSPSVAFEECSHGA